MPTSEQPIFFIGSGHGGAAAFRSLRAAFSSLEIVSADAAVLALARPQDSVRASLEATKAPVGVMAGYLNIIPAAFLRQRQVLNVHYSLLPRYRGLHALAWAMLNCERYLGWSVHLVNEFIDDGPLLYQQKTVYRDETSTQLMEAFDRQVESRLGSVVSDYLSGKIKPVAQDKAQATWVPRRNRESCVIDFSWPAERLRALLKVLVPPYPLPILQARDTDFDVLEARVDDRDYFCDLGRVVNVDGDGAWIKCSNGLLVVKSLVGPQGKIEASNALRLGQRLRKSA